MLERVANPDMPVPDILLDCRLVIRDSCGVLKIDSAEKPRFLQVMIGRE